MTSLPPEAMDDPFGPPSIPVEVHCLHCGQVYESYLIEWRSDDIGIKNCKGFWCCPIPGCDGKGFGFDIFPIDPDYRDEETGELMWERGGCGSDDEDCECKLCRADRGELDLDELDALFEAEDEEEEEVVAACDLPGETEKIDPYAEPMIAGGMDDEDLDALLRDDEPGIPLDDLLPDSELEHIPVLTPPVMIEIERKLGMRDDVPEQSHRSSPSSGEGNSRSNSNPPELGEDDIPY